MAKFRWSDDAPASNNSTHPSGQAYGWGPTVNQGVSYGPGIYQQRNDFGSSWHGPPHGAPKHVYAIGSHLHPGTDQVSPSTIPIRPIDPGQADRKAA